MHGQGGNAGAPQRRVDLHDTPRVRRRNDRRSGGANGGGLPVTEPLRHLRLGEIVTAGAAATRVGIRQLDELEARHLPEQRARRVTHSLPVGKVARVVVGDAEMSVSARRGQRVGCEEFGDVTHLGAECAARAAYSGSS